ncbi:MAG: cytochrome c [Bryobacteraceae bacterium]
MRVLAGLLIVVCCAIGAPHSVWKGVYSKDQAGRGRRIYNSLCARCHGEDLLGGENFPPLADKDFLEKWHDKSVGLLVDFTLRTMPSGGPGKLSRRQCVDIITYILSANGFPPGAAELETDPAVLNQIVILQKPRSVRRSTRATPPM